MANSDPMTHTKLDPREIFYQALRFKVTEEYLRYTTHFDPNSFGAPIMVCSVFASELFLKTLLALEGKNILKTRYRTHLLDDLYKELTPENRLKIEKLWNDWLFTDGGRLLSAIDKAWGTPVPRDLPGALGYCADAFRSIRYHYEPNKKPNGSFYVFALPQMLTDVIFGLKPEWRFLTK